MRSEAVAAMRARVVHEVRQHGDHLRVYCIEPGQGGDVRQFRSDTRHFLSVAALPNFRPAFCWRCGSPWPGGPKFNGWIHNSPCESCHGLGCPLCDVDDSEATQ